jgi:single-stranded-DNA-specific exonuclease
VPAPPLTRTWRLLPRDQQAVDRLARALPTSPIVAQLLLNRGVRDLDQARRFLDPLLKGLHPPQLLPGISEAVERLFRAVEEGKRVCVYGDYDVDGVTGTAILLQALTLLGARPDRYVPHRLEEGYGLNREALRLLAKNGVQVVLTVDCGIASLAEAALARELGLELIVTDHHEPKSTLPDASVLVHPRLPGGEYPFGGLSGSAVAFKLAWALAMRKCGGDKVTPAFREMLLDAVALAALGVVADVVPLVDENRILVRAGLARLADKAPVGLQALCEVADVNLSGELRASDIGFRLAPRLNAVGRLGQAEVAVELLLTTRRERAVDLARHCDSLNEMRQKLERETVKRTRELAESEGRLGDPALVLASGEWHAGVVGIVAGRLAEQYGRPALLITLPTADPRRETVPYASGSGRSIPGVPLHEALAACGDLLAAHGGHEAAAGFRLPPENIDAFRERFCAQVAGRFPSGMPTPELVLDDETPLSALTPGLVNDLDRLEPYGAKNRKPLFLAGGLTVEGEPRKVGQGERHLSFRVRQGTTALKAIGWNMAERVGELMSAGGACCLAFTPRRNVWQGRVSVDLEVSDFQPGPRARLA